MLCISSILNARDDGMQHMRFGGSCGDFTAMLISHASIFLFLIDCRIVLGPTAGRQVFALGELVVLL